MSLSWVLLQTKPWLIPSRNPSKAGFINYCSNLTEVYFLLSYLYANYIKIATLYTVTHFLLIIFIYSKALALKNSFFCRHQNLNKTPQASSMLILMTGGQV